MDLQEAAMEARNGHRIPPTEEKVIIDTDPGIGTLILISPLLLPASVTVIHPSILTITNSYQFPDDSVAIMMAFEAPGVKCDRAGRPEVPVAEGSAEPLKGGKPHVADFVHGSDGLGNTSFPDPTTTNKVEQSAAEFLVDKVSESPGEISVLALGPLTNIALAMKKDSSFASKVKRIVVLGGAFFAAGNATPSAEANIHSDPEAADIVFTSGADIYVVGLNITTQVYFTDKDMLELRNSKGKHAQFLCDICKFYRDWHVHSYGVDGPHMKHLSFPSYKFRLWEINVPAHICVISSALFLHDPVSFTALVHPEYFTFKKGVVRVETQGICKGHTSMDMGLKKWNSDNPWTGYSPISVAWTVDVPKVLAYAKELLFNAQ
uniref:Inosine/uridine-preferring nucleoside hydrolase domain-containing protein n=1 Tax=Oryza rufipogon TaxID=4529 RepID=A0A0E0QV95_ORYRU